MKEKIFTPATIILSGDLSDKRQTFTAIITNLLLNYSCVYDVYLISNF